MMGLHPVVAVILVQRLLELWHSAANTRRLRVRGAIEVGAGHYPAMVALHAAWWLGLAATIPADYPPHAVPLAAVVALMAARLWVLLSLGPYWTTRVLTLPGAPLVRTGPYARLHHPNYWIVAGEVALVPLCFDAIALAVGFSVLNGAMLAWRVAVEDRALASRRITARENFAGPG